MANECVVVQFIYDKRLKGQPVCEFHLCLVGSPAELVGPPFESPSAAEQYAKAKRFDLMEQERGNLWPVKQSHTIFVDKRSGISVVRVIVWFGGKPSSIMQPNLDYWMVMRGTTQVLAMMPDEKSALALAEKEVVASEQTENSEKSGVEVGELSDGADAAIPSSRRSTFKSGG